MDKTLRDSIIAFLLPYDPIRIAVFGSFARGEQKQDSDLDVLIAFKKPISLLQLVQMEQELGDLLGIPIDLVTENGLKNTRLRNYMEKDLITIYG